jgi:glutamyl-tRNA reductase
MKLSMTGINFHSAPVEFREKVAFTEKRVLAAIEKLNESLPGAELAILSTCNRTEIYAAANDTEFSREQLSEALLNMAGTPRTPELDECFYGKTGLSAAEHLIAVASSLDSMVVGETEILGQVKQAYMLAIEKQPDCKHLHNIFQHALKAAKRVHTDTEISRGRVSVSSIAVDFTRKIFDSLSDKAAMIVGAGETGESTLGRLVEKGVKSVLVVNRSVEKAQALAQKYGGRAIPFDLLDEFLPQADIVISSTSAPHCVITAESVRRAMGVRKDSPMLFIDIAVPRDIEEAVGQIEDAYLYNIDDLQKIAEENMGRRWDSIEHAKAIVKEEAAELNSLFERLGSETLLKQIDECARRIRTAEVERFFGKSSLANLPEPDRQEINRLVHQVVSSILADPKRAIKKAEQNGRWSQYSDVVKDMFRLEGKDSE